MPIVPAYVVRLYSAVRELGVIETLHRASLLMLFLNCIDRAQHLLPDLWRTIHGIDCRLCYYFVGDSVIIRLVEMFKLK